MLRKLLIATAMLTASGASLAHNDVVYGRVIHVEPSVTLSFGTGYNNGFRILYESGGQRYWTYSPRHPGHVIMLPTRYRIQPVQHHQHRDRHNWKGHRDWQDDRRENRRYGRY
jgi:hypothetical protein